MGWGALYTNKSNENVAIGMCSLYSNTTGVDNVAVGICSLKSNTTGKCNVAIGKNALHNNTTGFNLSLIHI